VLWQVGLSLSSICGVRVVLAYVTGVIRGQVTILNYELPQGVHLQVSARHVGYEATPGHFFSAETDDRGRFTFEGLAPGDYELSTGAGFVTLAGVQPPRLTHVERKVAVSNGVESTVTLVLKVIEK
jgi:hypothetical protein